MKTNVPESIKDKNCWRR